MSEGFGALGLGAALVDRLAALGLLEPTPVQQAAIPELVSGRDLVGVSATGSGKTAAFVLPILDRVAWHTAGPQALILCPTRELGAQAVAEVRRLGGGLADLVVVQVTGGQPIRPQIDALARGVHVVVGTPGRVLDHLERGTLDGEAVRCLVLDEADRMLDMGFGDEVDAVLAAVSRERQTALFTATWPEALDAVARRHLSDPARVTIDAEGSDQPEIHTQRLTVAPGEAVDGLCRILHAVPHDSALVFCNLKATVRTVVDRMQAAGVPAGRLDGDLDQHQRDQSMAMFRNGSVRVLVATDVAGRGLDVDGLDLVVNLELPPDPAVYVHRIGRTGRAGRPGRAVSVVERGRTGRVDGIVAATGRVMPELPEARDGPDATACLTALAGPPAFATLRLSGGRRDKLRPGDVLGALTGVGGLEGSQVGRIEVRQRETWVAVAWSVADQAVRRLDRGRVKRRKVRVERVSPIGADAG